MYSSTILLCIPPEPSAHYKVGCRACELACSYHHAKVFSSELSSIKVQRNNRTGKIIWVIDSTCDFCKEEEEPLCAKFCFYGGIKFEK